MAPRTATSSKAAGKKTIQPQSSSKKRKRSTCDTSSFVSEEAASRYESDMVNRGTMVCKPVQSYFLESNSPTLVAKLQKLGWLDFLAIQENAYPTLVQSFYSNLTFDFKKSTLSSLVNGTKFQLSFKEMATLFKLPRGRHKIYESKKMPKLDAFDYLAALKIICGQDNIEESFRPKATHLTFESRLIHHIISFNILPKLGCRDDVSFMDVVVIWAVMSEFSIDLPFIIARTMEHSRGKRRVGLPFGSLITLILKDVGVELENEHSISPHGSYDVTTPNCMGFKLCNGIWVRKDVGRASVPGPSNASAGTSNADSESQRLIPDGESFARKVNEILTGVLCTLNARLDKLEKKVGAVSLDLGMIKRKLGMDEHGTEEPDDATTA